MLIKYHGDCGKIVSKCSYHYWKFYVPLFHFKQQLIVPTIYITKYNRINISVIRAKFRALCRDLHLTDSKFIRPAPIQLLIHIVNCLSSITEFAMNQDFHLHLKRFFGMDCIGKIIPTIYFVCFLNFYITIVNYSPFYGTGTSYILRCRAAFNDDQQCKDLLYWITVHNNKGR